MKVLIADPDWRFAQQTSAYLESHAHLVVQQPNPRAAVAHVLHWKPDLAIVSAALAETGILESLASANPPPAILLTEHMDRFDRAWQAWQRGGDELLLKPILKTEDLLVATIVALHKAAAKRRTRRTQLAASA